MAVPEKHDDVTSKERRARGKSPLRTGLSPTVERMFGALVVGSDEEKEDSPPELDADGAAQPGSR